MFCAQAPGISGRTAATGFLFCGVILLSGCVSHASTPVPSTEHTASAEPDYSYLDEVGDDGLIHGQTYTQLVGIATFDCMVDGGWLGLGLNEDGSIGGEVPPEQSDRYRDDLDACSDQAIAKYPIPEISDDGIRERYALELETRECLIEQGYVISEPPSVETWIEQYRGSGELWLPYLEVYTSSQTSAAKDAELLELCPDPAYRFYK